MDRCRRCSCAGGGAEFFGPDGELTPEWSERFVKLHAVLFFYLAMPDFHMIEDLAKRGLVEESTAMDALIQTLDEETDRLKGDDRLDILEALRACTRESLEAGGLLGALTLSTDERHDAEAIRANIETLLTPQREREEADRIERTHKDSARDLRAENSVPSPGTAQRAAS